MEKAGKQGGPRRPSWRMVAAAGVAAVAVAFAAATRRPVWALTTLPVPLGLAVYLASGGNMPTFMDADEVRNVTRFEAWSKDGDVFLAACGKCGVTWMMNVLHQLRAYENETLNSEFEDIVQATPWPVLRLAPGQPAADTWQAYEQVRHFWDHPDYKYRAFKLQSVPSDTPIKQKDMIGAILPFRKNRKYVVIVRNPLEQLESAAHFALDMIDNDSEYLRPFGMPDLGKWLSPERLADMFVSGTPPNSIDHLHGWAHHLCEDNVFLLHFTDLKKDPETWFRRLADFVYDGAPIPEEHWPGILERTSFQWMKKRSDKFRYQLPGKAPLVRSLVRTGKTGGKTTKYSAASLASIRDRLMATAPPEILEYAFNATGREALSKFCWRQKQPATARQADD